MKMKILAAAIGLFGALIANTSFAATYSFSFSNEDGAIGGTVTGTISLGDGDGAFTSSSASVDSFPAALNLGPPPLLIPQEAGTITVSGGTITSVVDVFYRINAATILAFDFSGSTFLDANNCACLGSAGVLDNDNSTLVFGPVSPVPIPASLPLLAFGIGGLGYMVRRKRKEG